MPTRTSSAAEVTIDGVVWVADSVVATAVACESMGVLGLTLMKAWAAITPRALALKAKL